MELLENLLKIRSRKSDLRQVENDWREAWLYVWEIRSKGGNFRIDVKNSTYGKISRPTGFFDGENNLPLEHPEGVFHYYKERLRRLNRILDLGYIPAEEVSESDPEYIKRLARTA
jgi:hypothetical protein